MILAAFSSCCCYEFWLPFPPAAAEAFGYARHFRGTIWGFSVLHCHGVFPSGDQQQQQKRLQQQEERVAKIHSSSKRKKQPKSQFSMGFRSYVRHFRGAILGLLRPSLPWCFPIRGPAAAAKASAAAGGKGSQNS